MSLLEQMAPLISPPPVSLWPPALGWWCLTVVILAILPICVLYRCVRRPNQSPPESDPLRQEALEMLAELPKPYHHQPAGPWLQALNQLLKRTSRERWPEHNSHTLSGRAWLAFLDNRCPTAGLTRWMILAEGGYRADCRLDDEAVDALYNAVETWIRKHV